MQSKISANSALYLPCGMAESLHFRVTAAASCINHPHVIYIVYSILEIRVFEVYTFKNVGSGCLLPILSRTYIYASGWYYMKVTCCWVICR